MKTVVEAPVGEVLTSQESVPIYVPVVVRVPIEEGPGGRAWVNPMLEDREAVQRLRSRRRTEAITQSRRDFEPVTLPAAREPAEVSA